jgi:hypothetical protein
LPPPLTVTVPDAGWVFVRYAGDLPVEGEIVRFPTYDWAIIDRYGNTVSTAERDGVLRGSPCDGEDTVGAARSILTFLTAAAEQYGRMLHATESPDDDAILGDRASEWAYLNVEALHLTLHDMEIERSI